MPSLLYWLKLLCTKIKIRIIAEYKNTNSTLRPFWQLCVGLSGQCCLSVCRCVCSVVILCVVILCVCVSVEWWELYVGIFKKGNKSDPSNYRPISLTSTICKVMESVIRDHIMDFFFQNNYFSKISSGLLRADPLHYNCYALWMNGQHS